MRTHCPDALGGHTAYTPDEIGGEVVPVTVTETTPQVDPVEQAREACKAAGLTSEGLIQFCQMVSNGEASSLAQLPRETLDLIIQRGINAETVAKCNAHAPAAEPDPDPTEDPDDLPAAWSA
jgi:hypothetical protein